MDTCWLWQGSTKPNGYGQIAGGRRGDGVLYTHRVAWELEHEEPVPAGFDTHHRCGTRACCNPAHLELVAHTDHSVRAQHGAMADPAGIGAVGSANRWSSKNKNKASESSDSVALEQATVTADT